MNRLDQLQRILENVKSFMSENPEFFLLDLVINQIEMLIKITKKEIPVDKNLIEKLKLGWIYARELDGFGNEKIMNDIYIAVQIERDIKDEYIL